MKQGTYACQCNLWTRQPRAVPQSDSPIPTAPAPTPSVSILASRTLESSAPRWHTTAAAFPSILDLYPVQILLQDIWSRGGQIIRSWCGPRPQRVADVLHCVADEDQHGRGAARTAKVPKRGKRVKNADNAENTRTVQEKRASTAELSPMDPTNVIYSS